MSLAQLIPLWRTVRESGVTALVTPALDYVGGLRLSPLDVRFGGEDELAAVGERLRSFVASLEDGTHLLLLYRVLERSGGALNQVIGEYEELGREAHPAALREYRRARAEWLRRQAMRRTEVSLFFSEGTASKLGGALARGHLGLKLLFANLAKLTQDEHERRLQALATLRDRIASRLGQAGIKATEVAPKELTQLHYELLNPSRARRGARGCPRAPAFTPRDNLWSSSTVRSVGPHLAELSEAEGLTFEDMVDGAAAGGQKHGAFGSAGGYFRQGDVLRRVVTLKVLPEGGTQYFDAEPLLALSTSGAGGERRPFGYTVAVALAVDPQRATKWRLSTQHGLVDALRNAIPFLASSSIQKATEEAAKQGSIQALFQELSSMSSKLVTLSVSVVLDAPSVKELDARTEAARAAFNAIGNSELYAEEVSQVPAFLSTLPGAGPYQLRRKACTSRNAADFLPVFAPWEGSAVTASGGARSVFPTPTGDVFRLDLFDKALSPVHHLLGVADSGSGKSMGAGALLIDAIATGTEGILIDNGNSWRELTRLFGGTHVPVELSTALSPFAAYSEMLDEAGSLDNEAIAQAVRFIEVCAADRNFQGFDKPQGDFVGRAVRQCYVRRFREKPTERPLLSAFRDELLEFAGKHPDEKAIAESVARRLAMFCKGGVYENFLDRPSQLRFDAPLLTFDLASVSRDPILKPIAVAAIVEAVSARAAARKRRTIVAIDEAHEFLTDEVAARYVAGWYRKMRKFDVAMWALTQRFSDFLNCPVGPAIEGNAAIKFFLRHASGHELISRHFKFSPRTDAAFRNLEFKGGHYSDALFLYGTKTATLRLALHPLAYWVLTTDPEDRRLLDRAEEKNPKLPRLELLKAVADRYPHGVARAAREPARGQPHRSSGESGVSNHAGQGAA